MPTNHDIDAILVPERTIRAEIIPDGGGGSTPTDLARVAYTGQYRDLLGKPELGTAALEDVEAFATAEQGEKADTAVQPDDLATVATTGDYDDLLNKPTIPNPQIQSDWTQADSSAVDYIKNKPTIPAAQVNADWAATSGVAEILNKPTAVSAFTNDAGYVTSLTDLGITVTSTEINYLDGVRSDIQPQIDNKQDDLIAGNYISLTDIITVGRNKLDANCSAISTSATPSTALAINFNLWYLGFAFNGHANTGPVKLETFSSGPGTVTFKSTDASYGAVKFVKLKPNTQYSVGCSLNTGKRGAIMCYTDNGDNTYTVTTQIVTPTSLPITFTTNSNEVYGILLYSNSNESVTYEELRLYEGTDISVYVPYGSVTNTEISATGLQPTLVSGTNIKTVNGSTLLGSGDLELSTYLSFPAGWATTGTTKAFCDAIAADSSAIQGKAYLGEVTFSDLPTSMANAEVVAEIMNGTTTATKVIKLTCSSGNTAPYSWIYTYWNSGSNVSGWQGAATINDNSTSSLTETWSANKLNTTIGDIETLLAAI